MATLVNKGTQSEDAKKAANRAEVERLSVQHYVVKNAVGNQLIHAPIDLTRPGLRILDSATADGVWLRDLESTTSRPDLHSYLGFDINPGLFIAPEDPQITLVQQSIKVRLPSEWDNSFDLLNQRFAFAAATGTPLMEVIQNFIAVVKPGGWIQMIEMDATEAEGAAMIKVTGMVRRILSMVKGESNISTMLPDMLRSAGLEEVGHRQDVVLVGSKNPDAYLAKESIRSMVMTVQGLCDAAAHMPPGAMGEDISELPAWVEKELGENGGRWTVRTSWARKPL